MNTTTAPIRPELARAPAAARTALQLLSRLRQGQLMVQLPDGSVQVFGEAAAGPAAQRLSATLSLRNWNVCAAALKSGDIGFAETYIAGDWTTPNLTDLLKLQHMVDQELYLRSLESQRILPDITSLDVCVLTKFLVKGLHIECANVVAEQTLEGIECVLFVITSFGGIIETVVDQVEGTEIFRIVKAQKRMPKHTRNRRHITGSKYNIDTFEIHFFLPVFLILTRHQIFWRNFQVFRYPLSPCQILTLWMNFFFKTITR